jgi:hypothetical protein
VRCGVGDGGETDFEEVGKAGHGWGCMCGDVLRWSGARELDCYATAGER